MSDETMVPDAPGWWWRCTRDGMESVQVIDVGGPGCRQWLMFWSGGDRYNVVAYPNGWRGRVLTPAKVADREAAAYQRGREEERAAVLEWLDSRIARLRESCCVEEASESGAVYGAIDDGEHVKGGDDAK